MRTLRVTNDPRASYTEITGFNSGQLQLRAQYPSRVTHLEPYSYPFFKARTCSVCRSYPFEHGLGLYAGKTLEGRDFPAGKTVHTGVKT